MSVPLAAPLLSAKDSWNRTADRATIMRRLARWENWAWGRWRRYGPCDPFAPAIAAAGPPTWPVSAAGTAQAFPAIFVWESGSYAASVRLWCYVKRDAGTTAGKIEFVDGNRGSLTATLIIGDSTLGAGVLTGWVSIDVPIIGPNTLVPTLSRTSGAGTVYWHGVSGWWNAPATDFPTALTWTPISQTWAAAQKPHASYPIWRLIEQALYLTSRYPRPVVQKWWGDGMYDYAIPAGGAQTKVIGRYIVPFGPQTPDVQFEVHARGDLLGGGTNQPTLRVNVNGVQVGATITTTASWAWYSRTYTYGLSTEDFREVTLEAVFDAAALAGDATRIASFCGYEAATALTSTQLALPAGDAVPASFVQVDDGLIGSRRPILADKDSDGRALGLAQLMKNMVWLHANRRRRNLIADGTRWAGHRDAYTVDDGYPLSDGASDSSLTAAYRWGKSPDLSTAYNYASWLARTIPHASGWAANPSGAAFLEGYVAGSRYGGRVYGGAAVTPALAWGWVQNDSRGLGWTGNNGAPQTYWGKSPDPVTGAGGNRNPLFAGQATREKHSDEPVWANP